MDILWNRPGVGMTTSPIVAQLGPDVAQSQVCTLSLTDCNIEGNLTVDSSLSTATTAGAIGSRSAAVLAVHLEQHRGSDPFHLGDSERNCGYDRHRCGAFGVPRERVDVWFGDDLGNPGARFQS